MTAPEGTRQWWEITVTRTDTVVVPQSTETEARDVVATWLTEGRLPHGVTVVEGLPAINGAQLRLTVGGVA